MSEEIKKSVQEAANLEADDMENVTGGADFVGIFKHKFPGSGGGYVNDKIYEPNKPIDIPIPSPDDK